jgi:hypothetical protein
MFVVYEDDLFPWKVFLYFVMKLDTPRTSVMGNVNNKRIVFTCKENFTSLITSYFFFICFNNTIVYQNLVTVVDLKRLSSLPQNLFGLGYIRIWPGLFSTVTFVYKAEALNYTQSES